LFHGLALDGLQRGLHGLVAHLIGLLGNGGLHHLAGQDQIHGGGVAVEADDNHVVHAGGLAGVHGADSGIVIVAEHDVDLVGISVQQVLHGLGGAVGGVLAGQSVQNGDAGLVAGGLIALAAHIGGVVALLAIDDDGVGALTGLFSGPQAA
ncbi:CBS domain-containing protein, partial [Dysosmobacter welbionis]